MLHLSATRRFFLFQGNCDMRKGFDSLSGMVTSLMKQDVLSGDIFIFLNRKHNQVKLLHWEGDGFAIYYKRLEKGTYELPFHSAQDNSVLLSHQQLSLILQGISLRHVRIRKRYQHALKSCG